MVGGYAWVDPLPAGWTTVADTPGTVIYKVTLPGASCQLVTPAPPTVTQAVCVDGVVSEPTLTLPNTNGITLHGGSWWPVYAGAVGDGDGDVGGGGGRVAGDDAVGVDADVADDGDVSGGVRSRVVHAGGAGGCRR